MTGRTIFYIIFLCINLGACNSNSKKNQTETISYKNFQFEDKDWKSKKVTHFANNIYYRATEVPMDFYLLKYAKEKNIDSLEVISNQFKNERIIEIEFEQFDGEDLLEEEFTNLDFDKAVQYLSSEIQNDFLLVSSLNDTIKCSGVQFERHFKISPFKRVLLYFGGVDAHESVQLIYLDRLFNNGIFKFKFDEIPLKT